MTGVDTTASRLSEALDLVDTFLNRFVSFSNDSDRHAVTLWVAHTHLIELFDTTPRLVVTSPEKQSGKPRCLEIVSLLVPEAIHTTSVTPAALYRLIKAGPIPTVLFDEYDTLFGYRSRDGAEDLRALINAGHRRGVTIPRCQPPSMTVEHFPTFAPMALAGIGDLPDTIRDRSVIIHMRRRGPSETVEPFRIREHEPPGIELGDHLAEWADQHAHRFEGHIPENPLEDRAADLWEPLLTVGEVAGRHWASRAQQAARHNRGGGTPADSVGIELLSDIRAVWPNGERSVAASSIIELLCADDELRWSDHRGKKLTARALASILKPYGIISSRTPTARVYLQGDLQDAWTRYLSDEPSQVSEASSG